MADPDSLTLDLADAVGAIDPATWDSLAGDDDPFAAHAFFTLLEASGSVGAGTGWQPLPLVGRRGSAAIAAVPAYVKYHSQGEYVFDHGWAEAWERAGRAYYPKLQVAAPFSPVVGRRLLGEVEAALACVEAVAGGGSLSSAHATFLTDAEAEAARARGWLVRAGVQYHWHNRGYADFDAFLDALASRKRKSVRRERARAVEGLRIVEKRGRDIAPADMAAMWHFYQDTGGRKWGRPYLTRAFFDGLVAALGDRVLLFLALDGDRPVAGALNLVGRDTLYGRYWGASEERPFLHFELSYYRAIDWAIRHRVATVQAGAQGEHKLARGYEPVITRSAHWLPDPGFRAAVADFLARERAAVDRELDWARAALPYRASDSA